MARGVGGSLSEAQAQLSAGHIQYCNVRLYWSDLEIKYIRLGMKSQLTIESTSLTFKREKALFKTKLNKVLLNYN